MIERLKRIDWTIVAILLLFMVASSLLIYSATVDHPTYGALNFHKKNVINYALGFAVLFAATFINYRILLKAAPYLYGIGIILLVALYFFGEVRGGARGWFTIPVVNMDFQPAELMKLIIIIAISAFLRRKKGEPLQLWRDVVPIGLIVLVPFVLVVPHPDLGNAMIYLVILIGMYWIGNIKYKHVLIGLAIMAALLAGMFWSYQQFHDEIVELADRMGIKHWVERIDTFIDPSAVSPRERYQFERSLIAIGSGGLTGDGFLKGNSVHNNFIPVVYSDAIFVVVGEEFGFTGAAVLLLLFFILIYRMILVVIQTSDLGGSYIIVGIVTMFVFQIFQNIGMFIGLMPLTGITLPFISYGGTSLLINMLSLGLVMSVRVHQEKESMFSADA